VRAVTGGEAIVVQPQQLDHHSDVVRVLDPAGGRCELAGEDGVIGHLPFGLQPRCGVLGEKEVRGVIAVEVADLTTAERKCVLASPAGAVASYCTLLAYSARYSVFTSLIR